jgi:DNA recombination protein RmuC
MTVETLNLTRALKGETKTQGNWGEMILGTILARSGLREGHEYVTQDSHITEDGRRQILDVLIKLPDGKGIIVDSKVSLKDFEAYVNAETDLARAAHLKAHTASLRSHVKLLSEKTYQKLTDGGLDFVVMFVPSEGALAAALSADPDLIGYANERNVTIVTPTTLMIALRTVANVWHVENRNRNAEQIAERAGQLYDKFVGFVGDMSKLDNQLRTVRTTFDDSFKKLQGKGGLASRAENLKLMGAKATKALPTALLDDEEPEGQE